MSLYLDSAIVSEAEQAFKLPWTKGVTTNPILLSQSEIGVEDTLNELCTLARGTVFYQITGEKFDDMVKEGEGIINLNPDKLGLKIPCTTENLNLAHYFVEQGVSVAITSIFSPAQVLLAAEAGVGYIIPYVNRSERLLGDGPGLVGAMREVLEVKSASTEILAASIKSPEEAVSAFVSGAHHLSLPVRVLLEMGNHELSEETIKQFAEHT